MTRASISQVKVTGPAKARRGKTASYRVSITNSGNADATGVRARISGRGVSVNAPVGTIRAGVTRKTGVKVKFRKRGRVTAKVVVTSANAGSKTANKVVRVVR